MTIEYWTILETCPGFSGPAQIRLFERLAGLGLHDILVLGVYRGRDLALLSAILEAHGEPYHLTGVDLFADAPCADWTEGQRKRKNWQAAQGISPPSLSAARANLKQLGFQQHVTLVKKDAVAFLQETEGSWDCVYVDTAHDYETTRQSIAGAWRVTRPGGWLAGDDYARDVPTWGVIEAVGEAFGPWGFELIKGYCWLARREAWRGGKPGRVKAYP